jgi:hypothetical protein
MVVTIPVKECCGVLVGDVCDCAAFAAQAAALFTTPLVLRTGSHRAAGPSTSYPTPTVFANVGGRLVPVEATDE